MLILEVKNYDIICLIIVLLTFISSNLLIGFSSLFSEKIVPPFVKFYCFNVKYLISYLSTISKFLGGISFTNMMYFIEKETHHNYLFLIFSIVLDCLSLICFIILLFNYNSLKMKALSKLKTIQS